MDDNNSFGRPFAQDEELPVYARAITDFDWPNAHMERGHMARHEDNEAWGEDNSRAGCLMSNIAPQHRDMNGEAWLNLEKLHQDVVVDPNVSITTVKVISGPIFAMDSGAEDPEALIANQAAVPESTYKVIQPIDK